jgi:hypothetical protein
MQPAAISSAVIRFIVVSPGVFPFGLNGLHILGPAPMRDKAKHRSNL